MCTLAHLTSVAPLWLLTLCGWHQEEPVGNGQVPFYGAQNMMNLILMSIYMYMSLVYSISHEQGSVQ